MRPSRKKGSENLLKIAGIITALIFLTEQAARAGLSSESLAPPDRTGEERRAVEEQLLSRTIATVLDAHKTDAQCEIDLQSRLEALRSLPGEVYLAGKVVRGSIFVLDHCAYMAVQEGGDQRWVCYYQKRWLPFNAMGQIFSDDTSVVLPADPSNVRRASGEEAQYMRNKEVRDLIRGLESAQPEEAIKTLVRISKILPRQDFFLLLNHQSLATVLSDVKKSSDERLKKILQEYSQLGDRIESAIGGAKRDPENTLAITDAFKEFLLGKSHEYHRIAGSWLFQRIQDEYRSDRGSAIRLARCICPAFAEAAATEEIVVALSNKYEGKVKAIDARSQKLEGEKRQGVVAVTLTYGVLGVVVYMLKDGLMLFPPLWTLVALLLIGFPALVWAFYVEEMKKREYPELLEGERREILKSIAEKLDAVAAPAMILLGDEYKKYKNIERKIDARSQKLEGEKRQGVVAVTLTYGVLGVVVYMLKDGLMLFPPLWTLVALLLIGFPVLVWAFYVEEMKKREYPELLEGDRREILKSIAEILDPKGLLEKQRVSSEFVARLLRAYIQSRPGWAVIRLDTGVAASALEGASI